MYGIRGQEGMEVYSRYKRVFVDNSGYVEQYKQREWR